MRCRRQMRRCAPRSTAALQRWVGPRCTPSWRWSTPSPPPDWPAPMANASSARTRGVAAQRTAAVGVAWRRCFGARRARRRLAAGVAGAGLAQLAARAHRAAFRQHAGRRPGVRSSGAARARRPARRAALDALRGLSPDLASAGGGPTRRIECHRRRRNPPARQTPTHVVTIEYGTPGDPLRSIWRTKSGCRGPGQARNLRQPPHGVRVDMGAGADAANPPKGSASRQPELPAGTRSPTADQCC